MIRNQVLIDSPCQGEGEHVGRTGSAQGLGAFVDRRAGCEDIINEQDAFVHDLNGVPYDKRTAKIGETIFTRQGGLGWRGGGTDQIGVGEGNVQMSSDPVREQQCLVELSLAEPFVVQRDRDNQIDGIQPWKCREHQIRERRHQGNLTPIPAFPVTPIDTNGAGDAFAAGTLFGITHGYSLTKAGRWGNYVASRMILEIGARLSDHLKGQQDSILAGYT